MGGWPGTAQLLPDGRVLASGPGASTSWYTFSPDQFGSYQHGTWKAAGSSTFGRQFHPGFVMQDGRYWNGGGEYVTGTTSRATNEIFDPATDTWTAMPDMPQEIADTPTAMLGNGHVMVLSHESTAQYSLWFYPIPTWSVANYWPQWLIGDQEASSLLLQNGEVLVGSGGFALYQPLDNSWNVVADPPASFLPTNGDEMGPMVLLHDGRALVLGGNGHNALFTPPTLAEVNGTWQPAQDTPVPYNHGDAPSVVEPDGKVLTVVTDDQSGEGLAVPVFYEYDPTQDSWTAIPSPGPLDNAETVVMMPLPNGQIWVSGSGASTAYLYTPAGTPQLAWQPSVGSITIPGAQWFKLTGVNLGGSTTGGDFGDDAKMATNFPIVSLTDHQSPPHVWYGRTSGFDDMTPGHTASTWFSVPDAMPDGTYTVHVSANGVKEALTHDITFSGPHATAISGPNYTTGGSATGSVTIDAPAPVGGVEVELSSSNPQVAAVPPSVIVPQGSTGTIFSISGVHPLGSTLIQAFTAANPRISIKKTFGWSITSLSGPPVTSGSTTASWTVTIDNQAPANGVVVNLTSTDTSIVTVPATVTVPQGQKSVSFTVTTVSPQWGQARIYASLMGSTQSQPFGWSVAHFQGPATPTSNVNWTLSLNGGAPPSGIRVGLSSSNPAFAAVPSNVTVPSGSSSTNVAVTVSDPTTGFTDLVAKFADSSSAFDSTSSTRMGWWVTGLSGNQIFRRGTSWPWTVTLGAPAPAGGLNLTVTSSDWGYGYVSPDTIYVPAGQTSATFYATEAADPTEGQSTITVGYGTGAGHSEKSRVLGYQLGYSGPHTVNLSGGGTVHGTITVSPPPPTGGLTCTLQSLQTYVATMPASVTIPGGATSVDVPISVLNTGWTEIEVTCGLWNGGNELDVNP
jgi:hypothetical protein